MFLELDRVSKAFGGLMAVRAMSVSVAPGEIVGLIGPNGAGKTTLFNLISGFYRADSGHITFRDRDVTRLDPSARCKHGIARTFQHARPFQHLSLLDNVAVGRIYGREPARTRRQAEHEARDLLQLVGLQESPEAHASTLTLMNRKRLELARALAARPALLLLDEWLAGLSPPELAEALGLVRRLRAQGITIVLVEHLVKALFDLSDRVVVMDAGEKIAEGPPLVVAADARVVEAYLGPELAH
jgi:branched-chain amino acid transport system ATP-binding protein